MQEVAHRAEKSCGVIEKNVVTSLRDVQPLRAWAECHHLGERYGRKVLTIAPSQKQGWTGDPRQKSSKVARLTD
jgi:hypothetical protein